MANRCPSCGGTLRFDIKKQKLVCEYCDSEFEADGIAQMGGASESKPFGSEEAGDSQADTIDAKIFTCPNCSAEVFATDLDAVEYCSYCGTFVTLESRLARLQKPAYILPFKITKEKCLEIYAEKLKKTHFLPSDMKISNAESSFHNIYIPFWVYSQKLDPDANLKFTAEESWTKGNTEYTQHYNINARAEGSVDGVFFDASATLDDRISEQIGNFSVDSLQEYNSSLMAGSYADVADVESVIYNDDVTKKCAKTLTSQVSDAVKRSERSSSVFRSPVGVGDIKASSSLENNGHVEAKLAMLPVWFMTWKNKKRLCYAVVNGNTGKMFAEIPADPKKYTIFSLILAVPIFILLECFFTFMPKTVLIITAILSLILMFYRKGAVTKLRKQDNREGDKGFQQNFAPEKKKSGLDLPFLLSIASAAGAFLVWRKNGPDDIPYYASAISCIITSFISMVSVVRAHNLSCSRPIPHFFDKRKKV